MRQYPIPRRSEKIINVGILGLAVGFGYDTLARTDPTEPGMTSRKPPSQTSGLVGVIVDHAVYRSFSQFTQTHAWTPAVNIYQVGRTLHVCVDLAGIERDKINVRIEPGRLTISGVRHAPEPKPAIKSPDPLSGEVEMKIHCMEIDHGEFCRVVQVSEQVDMDGVKSEYRQGLLWISLPLK